MKIYETGVGVMVGRREFGTVVVIVGDAEAKNDDICETVSLIVVELLSSYKPIIGGSFVLIPKLRRGTRSVFWKYNKYLNVYLNTE